MSRKLVTGEFRVSFPSVFKATSFEGQDPKFGLTMLFPKSTDLSKMEKAAEEAIEEKWGNKRPKKLAMPFKDGDDKIERMIKGRFRDIHLDHRDEEKRKSRLALIEPLEEMR